MVQKRYVIEENEYGSFMAKREAFEGFRRILIGTSEDQRLYLYRSEELPFTSEGYNNSLKVLEAYHVIKQTPDGVLVRKIKKNDMAQLLKDSLEGNILEEIEAQNELSESERESRRHMRIMRKRFGSDLDSDGLRTMGFPNSIKDDG